MKRAALALLLCSGCSWFKPKIITAPCPPPPMVERPELKFPKLPETATLVDIVTALVLDALSRDGYERKLEAILDAYRPAEPAKILKKEGPK